MMNSPTDLSFASERGAAPPASAFIAPGATLGVLGGGQLGRMFVQAAEQMGYATVVLDDDGDSPAGLTAHAHIHAPFDDPAGLAALADRCAAVTTEFENVPAQSLAALAARVPVAPAAAAVSVCQDRAAEKAHFVANGVPCAPHHLIDSPEALAAVPDALLPGILKTARLGYDGKGQARVASRAELAAAWQGLGQSPCLLEKRLALDFEISVIVARHADGTMVHLPVQHNLHLDGILAVTRVPAPGVSAALASEAVEAAQRLAASLHYVGVLCVEFFVLQDGRLVANEMAPRPHNSGHHSLDACDVSQFELQVRTLTQAPLVAPRLHSSAVMLNLLGDLWWREGREEAPPWHAVLGLPGTHLHLYGKADPRPGRKMGHLTVTAATLPQAEAVARQAAALLGLPAF
jgi:5-(carboxyamino)imidazole ribonucleotide synthase